FPVIISMSAAFEPKIAGVEDRALPVGGVGIQAGQAHEGLNGGARWVAPLQRSVEQRMIMVVAVGGVVLVRDACDEQVGVETRATDKRQHATVTGVDGHHGS